MPKSSTAKKVSTKATAEISNKIELAVDSKKEKQVARKQVTAKNFTVHSDALKKEDKLPTQTVINQMDGMQTTSARIRFLDTHTDGYTVGNIARMLGIRYQHARNVLTTPLKRAAKTEAADA